MRAILCRARSLVKSDSRVWLYLNTCSRLGGRLHCSTPFLHMPSWHAPTEPRDCIERKRGIGDEGIGRRFIEFSNFKLPTECQQTFLSDYFTSDQYYDGNCKLVYINEMIVLCITLFPFFMVIYSAYTF